MAALAQQANAGLLAKAATAPSGGWAMATGESISQSAGGGAPGYSASGGGFLAGIGGKVGTRGTSMGIAAGYDSTWLTDNDGGKASAGTARVGLYAAQTFGRFTLAADFLYGHANGSTTRPTGAGMANGKAGANSFAGGVQFGTEIEIQNYVLTPAAGLLVGSVDQSGFSETGGGYVPYFALRA
jgi:outer membrane autotransporter protein